MPSWNIHEAIAEILGYPKPLARRINEFIDKNRVHDIGRRLPRVRQWTDLYLGLGVSRRKCEKLAPLMLLIQSHEGADLFYLHHALDTFLSERIASAILINADIMERKEVILEGLTLDLKYLHDKLTEIVRKCFGSSYTIPYYSEILITRLRDNWGEIISLKDYVNWIRSSFIEDRLNLERMNLHKVIREIVNTSKRKADKYKPPSRIYDEELRKEFEEAARKNYFKGIVLHETSLLVLKRSRLYDYILTYGGKRYLINELLKSIKPYYNEPRILRKVLEGFINVHVRGVEIPCQVIDKYISEISRARQILEGECNYQ